MHKFLITYYGGDSFESPEQGKAHMTNWMAWMQGLGDAVVDPGIPVGASKTVGSDRGVTDTKAGGLCGITIVQADTMDQALEMAKSCPHLDLGGTIDVAQAMDM